MVGDTVRQNVAIRCLLGQAGLLAFPIHYIKLRCPKLIYPPH
jgi:hypothetical protein